MREFKLIKECEKYEYDQRRRREEEQGRLCHVQATTLDRNDLAGTEMRKFLKGY